MKTNEFDVVVSRWITEDFFYLWSEEQGRRYSIRLDKIEGTPDIREGMRMRIGVSDDEPDRVIWGRVL